VKLKRSASYRYFVTKVQDRVNQRTGREDSPVSRVRSKDRHACRPERTSCESSIDPKNLVVEQSRTRLSVCCPSTEVITSPCAEEKTRSNVIACLKIVPNQKDHQSARHKNPPIQTRQMLSRGQDATITVVNQRQFPKKSSEIVVTGLRAEVVVTRS